MMDIASTIPLMAFPPEFAILFLGIFVGSVLGYGLAQAGGNLKAAIAVVGAALGGGPVLFIEGVADARWSYPVGLVLGLLSLRLWFARKVLVDKRVSKGKTIIAWLDIVIIIVITLAAAIWTAIPESGVAG